MKKKRILIFSLVYYPNFIGGAEVAIKEITDRLARENFDGQNSSGRGVTHETFSEQNSNGQGFEFDMVTLRLDANIPKVEKIGNITVYRVGWTGSKHEKIVPDSLPLYLHLNKFFLPITAFVKAMSLYRKHHYDVIWNMMATYQSFGALFFKWCFPKIKFLLTLQEGDPIPYIKKKTFWVWPLFKSIFTNADMVQVISKYLGDFAREMGVKTPVIVVPNAVDMERFTKEYSEEEINEVKEKIGKKEGDITLITTSRLVSKNAVEDIISALPLLPENVKLVIAGRGYMEEGMKKQASILGVEDRVNFIGWLTHSEMPKYLKASDIFIRTPISEGFGNSYVEAMAAGIPCIATPVGGILDFLKDGETGLFAEVRNHESIADAVMKLVRNPLLVSKIKREAFQMVKDKYDWEIIACDMRKIFETI